MDPLTYRLIKSLIIGLFVFICTSWPIWKQLLSCGGAWLSALPSSPAGRDCTQRQGVQRLLGLPPKHHPMTPRLPEIGDLQLLCTSVVKVSFWIKGALATE